MAILLYIKKKTKENNMKTLKSLFAALALVCFFGLPDAYAVGLGLYGSTGGGTADWSPDTTADFRKSSEHQSYGFALDTAPASDNLFNYNLNFGYDRFSSKNTKHSNAWENTDLEGVLMSHNFGFGGLITPSMRVWFGPELRIEWLEGAPSNFSDYKIRLFGVGFGPVLGLNFSLGERLTGVFKVGYQNVQYHGYGRGRYSHTTDSAIGPNEYDYDIREKLVYVTFEFLARTSGSR
jgi:hypothetical protein